MTYERLLPALRVELISLGVSAAVLRDGEGGARPSSPVAALGIRSCSVAAGGFDVQFSITLLSPRRFGPSGCDALFSQLSRAATALSSAFASPVLSCGDTSFDAKTDCFVCKAELSCFAAASGGESTDEGVFRDFKVLGVEL